MCAYSNCRNEFLVIINGYVEFNPTVRGLSPQPFALGSEKIRLMERKMKNEILGSAYSPDKTLQNEHCLMKIDQSSQKIQSFEVESQHST